MQCNWWRLPRAHVVSCLWFKNKFCVIYRWLNYFGTCGLLNKLEETFSEDHDEPATLQQYQSIGHTQIIPLFLHLREFLRLLEEKLNNLKTHSSQNIRVHISKCTKKFIIKGIFNPSRYHQKLSLHYLRWLPSCQWSKEYCTLQSVYLQKVWSSIKAISFCFNSDDLEHDTAFVYHSLQLSQINSPKVGQN